MRATGSTTKRGAITAALEQAVARAEQHRALDVLIGTGGLDDLLDPEVQAQARR